MPGARPSVAKADDDELRLILTECQRWEDTATPTGRRSPGPSGTPIFSLDPAAGQAFMTEVAAAVRPAAETGGPPAAVDAFFPLVCPGLWSRLDEAAKDRYRANGPMMLAEFAGPPYQLGLKDVTGIAPPCLVIAGTESHPALRAIATTLARALPGARFVELAGSGHVTYAERPDEFARAVAAFATKV